MVSKAVSDARVYVFYVVSGLCVDSSDVVLRVAVQRRHPAQVDSVTTSHGGVAAVTKHSEVDSPLPAGTGNHWSWGNTSHGQNWKYRVGGRRMILYTDIYRETRVSTTSGNLLECSCSSLKFLSNRSVIDDWHLILELSCGPVIGKWPAMFFK